MFQMCARTCLMSAALFFLSGPSLTFGGDKGMMGGMHKKNRTGVEIPAFSTDRLPDPESEGARLFLRYCAQCHNLPSPASHSSNEWPEVIARMDGHMKAGAGMGHREMMRIKRPTDPERKTIEGYLMANGLKPFAGKPVPDPESPGGKLFQKICSGCHALPDIGLHTPQEWPDVVERMRMNMKVLGREGITGGDRDAIVGYLKKHSR